MREIVGLDMAAAKAAFSQYLDGANLDSRQIYFVNQIVEYIVHCASLENTMYNPILPRLSIVKFQMHYTILFYWMSRRFIPFVVKLWSSNPDK